MHTTHAWSREDVIKKAIYIYSRKQKPIAVSVYIHARKTIHILSVQDAVNLVCQTLFTNEQNTAHNTNMYTVNDVIADGNNETEFVIF